MNSKALQQDNLGDLIQKTFSHLTQYMQQKAPTNRTEQPLKKIKNRKYLTQDEMKSIVETSLKIKEELTGR